MRANLCGAPCSRGAFFTRRWGVTACQIFLMCVTLNHSEVPLQRMSYCRELAREFPQLSGISADLVRVCVAHEIRNDRVVRKLRRLGDASAFAILAKIAFAI